jgi:hypothetical protein
VNAPTLPPAFTVTHRRVLAISVPMTLANATTPLLGVVATAAIGRLGQAHLLGAVAMASVVFDCLFWLFVFLRFATTALTAQALGAGDVAEQRTTLIRALLLAAANRACPDRAASPARTSRFSPHGRKPRSHACRRALFHVRIWSAPFVLANAVLLGWLIGLRAREHRARPAGARQCGEPRGDHVAGALHRARRHRRGLRGLSSRRRPARSPVSSSRSAWSARGLPALASVLDREQLYAPVPVNPRHLHPDRRC